MPRQVKEPRKIRRKKSVSFLFQRQNFQTNLENVVRRQRELLHHRRRLLRQRRRAGLPRQVPTRTRISGLRFRAGAVKETIILDRAIAQWLALTLPDPAARGRLLKNLN